MRRVTLFVLFEGLGYELADRAGFLAELAPHRYPLRTVLGDSFAALPTALTACAPCEHGRWARFPYAAQRSPFRRLALLRHLPAPLRASRCLRTWAARLCAHRRGWSGGLDLLRVPFALLPLLDYAGRRDPFEPGGLSPCSTALDRLRQEGIPFFLGDGRRGEAADFQAAARALHGGEAPFAFLQVRGLAQALHHSGPQGEPTRRALAASEARIARLHAALASHAAVRLYVGGDQGLLPAGEAVDIRSRVQAAGLRLGEDYFAFYEPTMARFWFAHPQARHRVMGSLADVTRGRWLAGDQLRIEGLDFPDHRCGQAIFLLEPGLVAAPNYLTATAPAAAGGYHPEHGGTLGVFCANAPLAIPPRLVGDLCHLGVEGARWAWAR